MPVAGPRRQDQNHARVLGGADLVALVGVELREQPRPAADGLATRLAQLHGALGDDKPGTLVDLMLVEGLAGRDLDHDRAALLLGDEHLGLVRLDVQRIEVPGLHSRRDSTHNAHATTLVTWSSRSTARRGPASPRSHAASRRRSA